MKFFPETRGRTLEAPDADLRGHGTGHLAHAAPADIYGS